MRPDKYSGSVVLELNGKFEIYFAGIFDEDRHVGDSAHCRASSGAARERNIVRAGDDKFFRQVASDQRQGPAIVG